MIRIVCIPQDGSYTIECSECGPLGITLEDPTHTLTATAIAHMAEHGIEAQAT